MPLYTFHAFRADGAPLVLESAEFLSAELANRHAATILEAHESAQSVVIWQDDTEISGVERTWERSAIGGMPIPPPAHRPGGEARLPWSAAASYQPRS